MQLKNCEGYLRVWKEAFGFIRYEGRDIFVFHNQYKKTPGQIPEVGQKVRFDFALGRDGKPPMAVNIIVTRTAAQVKADRELADALTKQLESGAATLSSLGSKAVKRG
jgi:cold shock CspA family protein